jgi:hypothetical protein
MTAGAVHKSAVGQAYIAETRRRLAACHEKIKKCVGQLNDEQIWWRPHESMNSIANILLHLCGNVRQWIVCGIRRTPDLRNRPAEFAERQRLPKSDLLRRLEDVVADADAALSTVSATQLLEPRRIQGFDESVLSAIFDSVAHFNGHTQEIIYITRWQLGDAYQYSWRPATPEQGAP